MYFLYVFSFCKRSIRMRETDYNLHSWTFESLKQKQKSSRLLFSLPKNLPCPLAVN